MLRLLVVVLVLANGLFWAWTQGALAPWLPARADQREPERVKAQLRPELITVMSPKAMTAAVAAASEAAPASTPAATSELDKPVCLEAGPFTETTAKAAEAALAEAGVPDGAVLREQFSVNATWGVVMGKFPDRDSLRQKADELKRLGVKFDEMTTPAMYVPGLRLGNYSDRYGAEAALRDLAAKGVRTARVVELPTGPVQHWLRAPRADAELQTRLKALPAGTVAKGFATCVPVKAAGAASRP